MYEGPEISRTPTPEQDAQNEGAQLENEQEREVYDPNGFKAKIGRVVASLLWGTFREEYGDCWPVRWFVRQENPVVRYERAANLVALHARMGQNDRPVRLPDGFMEGMKKLPDLVNRIILGQVEHTALVNMMLVNRLYFDIAVRNAQFLAKCQVHNATVVIENDRATFRIDNRVIEQELFVRIANTYPPVRGGRNNEIFITTFGQLKRAWDVSEINTLHITMRQRLTEAAIDIANASIRNLTIYVCDQLTAEDPVVVEKICNIVRNHRTITDFKFRMTCVREFGALPEPWTRFLRETDRQHVFRLL